MRYLAQSKETQLILIRNKRIFGADLKEKRREQYKNDRKKNYATRGYTIDFEFHPIGIDKLNTSKAQLVLLTQNFKPIPFPSRSTI